MKVLIDCGGSSLKIEIYPDNSTGGILAEGSCPKPTSLDGFYDCIDRLLQEAKTDDSIAHQDVKKIAVSVCGEYDYEAEEVVKCWAYPFLKGKLKDKIGERFKCKNYNVRVVNDGDAHVYALKAAYAERQKKICAAVNLALGTGVGFGLLDAKGNLLHSCQGHNWEVGEWPCETKQPNKALWSVLGAQGLACLEKDHGTPDAYVIFGRRICHFLATKLVPVFHPQTIGLSGGIVAAHFREINEGIEKECEAEHYREADRPLHDVDIHLAPEKNFVMLGLKYLVRY